MKIPSEKMIKAGRILRSMINARSPQMIADRKLGLRIYRCCMVGSDMVDWLMKNSTIVCSRMQAVCMWQVLLEEGVLMHGKFFYINLLLKTD